jgi:hypothetical protein
VLPQELLEAQLLNNKIDQAQILTVGKKAKNESNLPSAPMRTVDLEVPEDQR